MLPSSANQITLLYLVSAGAWILLSGWVLDSFVSDADARASVERLKGIAFVLTTGVLLGLLLRRAFGRLEQTRARLADSNAELSELAEFARLNPNPVLRFDTRGELRFANDAAQAITPGQKPALILSTGLFATAVQRLRESQQPFAMEDLSGGRTWRWQFFPSQSGAHVFVYGNDRTEEKRLARQVTQAARMESVGRMAASIAHDFNNVLTAIGGYSDLLAAHAGGGNSDADELHDAVGQAKHLVQQLMMISRPHPPVATRFDLNASLASAQPLLRRMLPKAIALDFDLCPGPLVIQFDWRELEQALLNLLSNAADAMPGGGKVTLRTRFLAGNHVEFSVADTGSGIPDDQLPLIFDPFFTTKPPGKGTGLGLASVYGVMQRGGATVQVETTIGAGTRFIFGIPAVGEAMVA